MKKLVRTLMLAAAMLLPMALNAQTSTLTVCDSTANSDKVPFDGYNADADQHNQMIYPASMLTDMDGESILQMVFYIDASASNGSNTSESRLGTWTVSLGETTATTLSGLDATTTLTQVYQGYFDCSTGTLTIEFDSPYSYNGGNLLVDLNHSAASWNRWYFLGTTTTSDMSYNSYQEESYTFLPKCTFTYGAAPTCFKVQNAMVSAIGSTSVTLTWSDTVNSGATYTIYDLSDSSEVASNISGTSYTVTDLTPATNYTFGIGTDCGVNGVANGYATVSVFTNCAPMPLPFSETFDSTLSTNPCWRGASIVYAEGVVPTLGNNTNWTYQSSVSNGIAAGHYRVNIYGSSCYKWLVTPEIDLAEATSPLLTFDAAFTKYSGTGAATGFEGNATQKFYVLVSTDGGTTWSILSDVSLSSIASENYVTQFVDLSAYDGDTIRLAFYAQSTTSGGDNNLHLDNIAISESTGEICYPTTGLTVSNITATSATVTWNSSTVGNYVLYIMNDSSSYMYTDTVADLYTLQPNTEYTVGVTVDCPSGESPMITTSFRTACASETLPWSENFDSWTSKSPCWSFLSGAYNMGAGTPTASSSAWTLNSTYGSNITINGKALTMNVYSTNRYWAVTPPIEVTSDNLMLSVDVAVSAWSAATPAYDANDTLAFAVSTDGGATFTHVAAYGNTDLNALTATPTTLNVPISGYNNETIRIAIFAGSAASGGDNRISIDSISVTELTGDFCAPVTGLTVDSADAESISLSWTSDGSNFTVVDMATGSVVATTTDTYATVSGLTASTAYTFGVVNDCGSLTSDTIQISASTTCLNACTLTIAVSDAYGDGWGGYSASYLNVIQDDSTIFSYTMPDQDLMNTMIYDTLQVSVCGGEPLSLSWTSGGDWAYDDEVSFTLIDPAGVSFYILNDASTLPSDSVFFTDSDPCGIHTAAVGDSVKFTFAVNDATMGTTTPAPGEYYYFVGDALSLVATANPGYHLATWTLDITDPTGATNSQTVVASSNSFFDDEWDETVVANYFIGYEVAVTATFAADSLMGDTTAFTLEMAVNDAAMGYTTPAVGTYTFSSDTTLYLYATANPGYEFTGWHVDIYESGVVVNSQDIPGYQDTLYLDVTSSLFGQTYALTAQFAEGNDSLVIVTAVNNASMGTILPAPGAHVFHAGDTFSVRAIPNEGYHVESWGVRAEMYGQLVIDTVLALPIEEIFTLDTADYYLGMTYYFTANFAEGSSQYSDSSVVVITSVNDATMGTIDPAPGTHNYYAGDVIDFTITPNEGYHVETITVSLSHPMIGTMDTTYTTIEDFEQDMSEEVMMVDEEMYGLTISVSVVFAADSTQGISDVENDSFTVSAAEGTVVVLGAEGQQVTLFDVNGRMMDRKDNAAERVEFRVNNSGVYLVKVGNAAAKRVVVIR